VKSYRVRLVGRLDNPERYWFWYEPKWFLDIGALETMPDYVVTVDKAGREVQARQEVPPRPGAGRQIRPPTILAEPSPINVLAGPITPLAEAAVLVGTTKTVESEVRGNDGTEVPLLLRFLVFTTQYFLPGVRWDPQAHAGLVFGFAALMLLSAVASAVVCFLLARRFAFSRVRCIGWSVCGFVWGPVGLLLMLALQDWPARIACPGCRKPRVVARDTCEHCGAPYAVPAPDGTEIFEEIAATPHEVLARC
jgi:hypothetical protein